MILLLSEDRFDTDFSNIFIRNNVSFKFVSTSVTGKSEGFKKSFFTSSDEALPLICLLFRITCAKVIKIFDIHKEITIYHIDY